MCTDVDRVWPSAHTDGVRPTLEAMLPALDIVNTPVLTQVPSVSPVCLNPYASSSLTLSIPVCPTHPLSIHAVTWGLEIILWVLVLLQRDTLV